MRKHPFIHPAREGGREGGKARGRERGRAREDDGGRKEKEEVGGVADYSKVMHECIHVCVVHKIRLWTHT